ncbi:hypothetical protein [Halosimplex halobium]|uniref:hypothetical protein n=1 Tax=Halosimplex halobium TaxID=3396618 RepID=UPI003F573742
MSPSTYAVLAATVDRYRESGAPVTAAGVAESCGAPEAAVARSLESLCEFELLEPTDQGYRPTVTAREFLALDVEPDDVLVLDLVEE